MGKFSKKNTDDLIDVMEQLLLHGGGELTVKVVRDQFVATLHTTARYGKTLGQKKWTGRGPYMDSAIAEIVRELEYAEDDASIVPAWVEKVFSR